MILFEIIFSPFVWLFNILNDIVKSLYSNKEGFAWRKLGATYSFFVAGQITKNNTAHDNVIYLVIIWLVAMFLLIGLVTFPQLIEAYRGEKKDEKDQQ